MKVSNIGSNMTEVRVGSKVILVSYETPVAAYVNGSVYKTSKKWSRTTSAHISKWLDGALAAEKPQEFFDKLLK